MVIRIDNIIWLPQVVDRLAWKHHVIPQDVEEVLFDNPIYRKVQKGHIPCEDLYAAMGQTSTGRYLIIFFICKSSHEALLISAHDMSNKERKHYDKR